MSAKTELNQILRAYAFKCKNPTIDFENFSNFLEKYLEKHEGGMGALAAFLGPGFRDKLNGVLADLQEDGICTLQMIQDRIQLIRYLAYYIEIVEQEFKKILAQGERPFPSPESLNINLGPDLVTTVDIKVDFMNYLEKRSLDSPALLYLTFPDLAKTMTVTSRLLEKPLIEAALMKIRNHIRQQKNAAYLQHKILPVFRQKERILKDQMINIVTKPDLTLQEVMAPTDFVFQFWTHLSSVILKEYVLKKDKLEEEIDLCQASYVIGFYAVYFKGKVQKARESDTALKALAQALEKPPYAFTFHEVYNLTDSKGTPLSKRIDRDHLNNFFEKTTTPKDNVSLPEIIKVKTLDKKEFFIRRENVVKILLGRFYGLSQEFKNFFTSFWTDSLMNDRKLPEMLDEEKFSNEVDSRLRDQDPLFHSLLNFSLLFLLKEQVNISSVERDFLNSIFDVRAKSLASADKILNLTRKDIYAEAKLRLPFWKVIPLLCGIVGFFRKLLKPGTKKPKIRAAKKEGAIKSLGPAETDASPPDATKRMKKTRFKEEVQALAERYIVPGGDLKKEMSALVSLWNPLLDPQAKNNLVEDVNSLVRDFLRRLKFLSRLQVPDQARFEKLAGELSRHDALSGIRDKEHLKEYIALYMLEIMGRV